jgi:hypothetical protein
LQQRRAQERDRRAQFETNHHKDDKINQKPTTSNNTQSNQTYRQLSNEQPSQQVVSSPQTSSSTATSTPTAQSSSGNFLNTSSSTTTPSATSQSILKSRDSVDKQLAGEIKLIRLDKLSRSSSQVQFEESGDVDVKDCMGLNKVSNIYQFKINTDCCNTGFCSTF